MATNAGNTGKDYSFGFYDGNTGAIVDLGDVQSVKVQAQKHDLKNMPYNGPPKYDYVPDGYKLSFTITRTVSALEDLMVTREANFNAGLPSLPGYLSETVNNTDGSVSRYQYTGFVFFLTDHGDVSRDKTVTVTCEGMASTKVQIS